MVDVAKLNLNYSAPVDGPWRSAAPKDKPENEFNLPDLGGPPETEIRYRPDRIEFVNPRFSADRPLVSLQFKQRTSQLNEHRLDGPHGMYGHTQTDAKFRSPYLQHRARELAKDMISEPLKDAWSNREFDGGTAMALGLGLGGIAAAVNSGSEIKTRVDVYKAEVGNLKIRPGIGITSGHGKVDYQGARIKVSPIEQGNAKWNLDLDYSKRDDKIGLAYNREVSRVRVGPSIGQSYFQAGISKDTREGTKATLSYHLSY